MQLDTNPNKPTQFIRLIEESKLSKVIYSKLTLYINIYICNLHFLSENKMHFIVYTYIYI